MPRYILPVTDLNAQICNMHFAQWAELWGRSQEYRGKEHWHQHEHHDYIKMLWCTAYLCGDYTYNISSHDKFFTPPKMVTHTLQMVCGCPCGGVINSRTCSLLAVRLWNAFANVVTIWFLMSSDVVICQCTIHSFTVCILIKKGCISKSVYMCVFHDFELLR